MQRLSMAPRCQVGETDEKGGKTQIALFVSGVGRLLICGPNEILRKSQMQKVAVALKKCQTEPFGLKKDSVKIAVNMIIY